MHLDDVEGRLREDGTVTRVTVVCATHAGELRRLGLQVVEP